MAKRTILVVDDEEDRRELVQLNLAREGYVVLTCETGERAIETARSKLPDLIVDAAGDGHIVSINKAAAGLLSMEPAEAQSRSVEEMIRNAELHQFIRMTISSEQPTEADIPFPAGGGRFLQLHGASLPGTKGNRSGAVIMLHDVIRMRRLENVRPDFVANVSHELKTPVTSIQGFVEALLGGEVTEPKQADRHLKIIAKHSDRLNAIIEDLPSLSRLEESIAA